MTDILLYAVTVVLWGTSWIAVKMHLGVVAPEVSLGYRFALAAVVMLAACGLGGRRLRFGPAEHGWIALQGGLLFCANYLLIYHGTQYLTSGLVAVIFSSVVIFNIGFGALLFGHPIRPRVALGAAFGIAGIVAVFWHDIAAFDIAEGGSRGLALVVGGAAMASLGMLTSGRNQLRGIRVVEGNALGMTYGALLIGGWVALSGAPVAIDPRPVYWIALLFLSLFSTVLGFWAYLTLLGRIGADKAGYTTVMFPMLAIALSIAFEDYRPGPAALLGVLLVLAGNVLILTKGAVRPAVPALESERP